jgi:hypothetical protein
MGGCSLCGERGKSLSRTCPTRPPFTVVHITTRMLGLWAGIPERSGRVWSLMKAGMGLAGGGRRRIVTVRAELLEARGLPVAGDVYCDAAADGVRVATTPIRPRTQTPYWGEAFELEYARPALPHPSPHTCALLTALLQRRLSLSLCVGTCRSQCKGWSSGCAPHSGSGATMTLVCVPLGAVVVDVILTVIRHRHARADGRGAAHGAARGALVPPRHIVIVIVVHLHFDCRRRYRRRRRR